MLQPLSLLWSLDRGRANLHCTYICENVGNSFFTPNRFHSARKFVFEATMDGEDMEPDSGFLPNECASRVDGGVDRISQLPNEILFLILSLLPMRKAASTTVLSSRWLNLWKEIPNLKFNLKSDRISQLPDKTLIAILSFLRLQEAAATSVLSSRWSDLWKHSPCLDFDPYDVDSGHQIWDATGFEVVNSVIQLHKALSLKKFRISYPVKKSDKSAVTKCLDFAFSRKVESLELDFQCWDDSDKFVLQESLRESSICGDPQTLIFLKSLVSLHLECLKVSGEDIEMFLRNCPLLEELMIHSATLTSDVEVRGTTDLMLKRLEIYYCKGESSITVSAPNLTWITFRKGLGSGAKLSIESAPKLVGAAFTTKDPNFVGLQFACISQLQILILRSYYPMEFWAKDFPEMPNLKKLVIECCGGHNHSLLQVITLIRASPHFEEFTYKGTGSIIVPSAWIGVIPNVERPKPQSLKVFELQMPDYLAVNDDIVELVMYVLDNCVGLQKIVIGRWLWLPGSGITAEMRADANYILQRLQSKVVPNHIQLQFFGCDVVM